MKLKETFKISPSEASGHWIAHVKYAFSHWEKKKTTRFFSPIMNIFTGSPFHQHEGNKEIQHL